MKVARPPADDVAWEVAPLPTDDNLQWRRSLCPYCGVGCGLLIGLRDQRVVRVRGDVSHPANYGLLCTKGALLNQILEAPGRLLYPQQRSSLNESFQRTSWDQAFSTIRDQTRRVIAQYGPEAVGFYISGQLLTEDYYVVNKFVKGFLKTNNVDSNSRLCMASAVAGYTTSLGEDCQPASYSDIELADCFFLIGTNTAACHPVVFQRIKNRKTKFPHRVKVIVADPRRTRTADIADVYLPILPGTDVALLNGMLNLLIQEKFIDHKFIQNHTTGWEKVKQLVSNYSLEKTSSICGVPVELIREAALLYGQAGAALSFWSMGVNQSTHGVAKNNAIINLALATGNIGRPGAGPFSLTGQPNAMGGRETGGLAHLLPGHRLVTNAEHRTAIERLWEIPKGTLSPKPGLTAVELFQAMEEGRVKILWVIATNPAASLPSLGRVRKAFEKAELVICQDAFHPTETTQYAHLLLPAAQWVEREGTVTNSERRISLLEKTVQPPGEALADWEIISRFAALWGAGEHFPYQNAEEVYEEYKATTRGTRIDISAVTYDRLRKNPIQWPYPSADTPPPPRLFLNHDFPTPDGKARFHAWEYTPPAESPDHDYPFILTTGRIRDQWHTMTRTGKIETLMRSEPSPFIEIHPEDAKTLAVKEGEMIEVISRRGKLQAPCRITSTIRQGCCFVPFHWGSLWSKTVANEATIDSFDPVSKQPELKFCAVKLVKLPPTPSLDGRGSGGG